MADGVKSTRLALGAGALIAICVIALFVARPVPDAVVSLLGGPSGVDRTGGLRVRYRPPPGVDPAELARSLGTSSVQQDGGVLVLEFPGVTEDLAPELADVLAGGGLSMHEALETPYATEIARLAELPARPARRRSDEPPPGAGLELDTWQTDGGGGRHQVAYLEAGSLDELQRAIAAAGARGFRSAPGTGIGFERIDPFDGGPPRWRTYELALDVVADSALIERAVKSYDPNTGRPMVLLDFTAAGTRRFCDETRRLVGRKLATVLGGRIRSAPIINGAICGGQASIWMGGEEPRAQEREADMLVAVLRQPAVPPGGVVEGSAWRPPGRASLQEWIGRLLLGLGAGALGGLLAALVIRIVRPEWRGAPPVSPAGGFPYPRLAVTLLAPLAVYLGGKLALPGVNTIELEHLLGTGRGGSMAGFSVVALGVTPILSAFLLVELAALAIPPLRWRRHDPRGRVRLGQAVAALSIALAAVQGYFVAVYLEALSRGGAELVSSPGLGFRASTAATLAAGTMLLGALAGVIREHGLGNGYGAILVGGALIEVPALLGVGDGPRAFGRTQVLGLVALAAIAALTAAALRWRIGDPAGDDARDERGPRMPPLRVPASGIAPLSDAGGLATLLGLLAAFGLGEALFEPSLRLAELRAERWIPLVLVAALAPAWAYLLARPSLVERAARAAGLAPPSWRAWRRAAFASTALLVAIHLIAAAAGEVDAVAAALAEPVLAMLGTAVVLDLVDDARAHRRALAPAGVLHQIQHAGVVERVLADAGIPCHLHAAHLRTLLAFFGPFAPVIVLVPEDRAAEARLLLADVAAAVSGRAGARRRP